MLKKYDMRDIFCNTVFKIRFSGLCTNKNNEILHEIVNFCLFFKDFNCKSVRLFTKAMINSDVPINAKF